MVQPSIDQPTAVLDTLSRASQRLASSNELILRSNVLLQTSSDLKFVTATDLAKSWVRLHLVPRNSD